MYVSKLYIRPQLMEKLVNECPGIVGIKEMTMDLRIFSEMARLVGDKVSLCAGCGEPQYSIVGPIPQFKYRDFITVWANFIPEQCYELYQAAEKGDLEGVKRVMDKYINPLNDLTRREAERHSPGAMVGMVGTTFVSGGMGAGYVLTAIFKEAMNLMGFNAGVPRLPMLPITERGRKELAELLPKLGVSLK